MNDNGCRRIDERLIIHRSAFIVWRGSGRQALDQPGVVVAPAVAQPVVQPVRAPLPELDRRRAEAIAAPVRRSRDLATLVLGDQLLHMSLQDRAIGDDLALRRGPRAQAAAPRAALEVV